MQSLFRPDSPVMMFLTKVAYSAWLNILWMICSIPVFTIGAATTALFTVTQKMARNEEGHITACFFKAFRDNFRQSTIAGLIMTALGVVLAIDGYVLYHIRFENAFWTVLTAVFLVAAAAYAIILMYIFPLMAYFDNHIPAFFKNALMIGMRFLLCTLVMAVIYFAMVVVIVRVFTPAIVFGEGLCALLCSYLMKNILILCEPKEDREEPLIEE